MPLYRDIDTSDRPGSRFWQILALGDYYPGPGNFQEQTGIIRDHFYKSVICSRL